MSAPEQGFGAAARRGSLMVAWCMTAATAAVLALRAPTPLALAGPLALGLLVLRLRPYGGESALPNLVTALRVCLTGGLALTANELAPPAWAWIVGVVFVLDGVDGALARGRGAASLQGGHFDMEADAYLVLTVCCLHVVSGTGAWVLTGGLLRYAYVFAGALVIGGAEAPRTRFGRYAFATSLLSLTGALLLAPPASTLLAGLGTAVLAWSFGRSFVWLLAR
jgi:phosphatidylglycerophosphate synthase